MKLATLITCLESWAPRAYAEDFDNVGLLVGDREKEVNKILVTLDCLPSVVDEAIASQCNTIVTFHPIIFKGLKSLTGKNYVEKAVIKAIQHNIAIYAMHTNLDAVTTGVNGRICQELGLVNNRVLIPQSDTLYKLSTYIPKELVDIVLNKIYEKGAGQIGNYEGCSFRTAGTGTFTPNENASPAVGAQEIPQELEEFKTEVLVEKHVLSPVLQALQESHPYEEVAYEIVPLANQNQTRGMGMMGEFEIPITETSFLTLLKEKFNPQGVRHSEFLDKKIKKVAVVGGSGAFAISHALAQGADAFVSADLKYHDFFQAEHRILLADVGHYESEQYTKIAIMEYITKKFPNFAIQISNVNTNPIYYA